MPLRELKRVSLESNDPRCREGLLACLGPFWTPREQNNMPENEREVVLHGEQFSDIFQGAIQSIPGMELKIEFVYTAARDDLVRGIGKYRKYHLIKTAAQVSYPPNVGSEEVDEVLAILRPGLGLPRSAG